MKPNRHRMGPRIGLRGLRGRPLLGPVVGEAPWCSQPNSAESKQIRPVIRPPTRFFAAFATEFGRKQASCPANPGDAARNPNKRIKYCVWKGCVKLERTISA